MHSILSNNTHIFGWFSFFTALWSTITLFIFVERKSPEAFGGYKNFLRIYCFYAFIFSIIDWLAQPSALVDVHGFGYVFYSEDRLFDLGFYACHFVLIAYCGCFIASSSFLSLNFIYRYVSICKPRYIIFFKGWRVILLFLYCAVPFVIWSLLVYTIMGPTPERAAHLNLTTTLLEDVDLTGKPYVAVLCRHVANYSNHKYGEIEWGTMGALLGLFGFQGFFYTVSLVCGFLTYNYTLALFKKAQMSKELYKMQMQLLRAIVIQASVPLVLVYIPPAIMILGGMSGIYVGQIGYFVVMSISIYPPIDSLVFLFSIRCYRSALCCEGVTVSTSDIKSDLLSAGISESCVDGISEIARDFYTANKPTQQMDHETMATLFKQFMEKVGEYMKTQSPEDQAALKKLFEEKKADFEAKMAAAN